MHRIGLSSMSAATKRAASRTYKHTTQPSGTTPSARALCHGAVSASSQSACGMIATRKVCQLRQPLVITQRLVSASLCAFMIASFDNTLVRWRQSGVRCIGRFLTLASSFDSLYRHVRRLTDYSGPSYMVKYSACSVRNALA